MKKLFVSALFLAIPAFTTPALAQQLEVVRETADTRTVLRAFGETEIPAAPQHIVAPQESAD